MDRPPLFLAAAVLASASALGGCVAKPTYDAAVANAQTEHAALLASQEREKADEAQIADLKKQLSDAAAQLQARDDKLNDMSTGDHNLQAKLDEATAINAKLRGELERLGKNVDTILQEKGTISKALEDAKNRLEELRKAQAAAEARAQLFQKFVQKFKALVNAGQLKITTRQGRLVLQLPNDVLFDVGQIALKPAGKEALTQVAQVLKTVQGRNFQVAGNTDNLPIQTARFPSNWELSTERAVEVVKLLVSKGEDPRSLSAAGYGEFDPVANNESAEGRAKNRRIEITLQPNLDELVAAPDIK
jgi:chemotaxis protein MotB